MNRPLTNESACADVPYTPLITISRRKPRRRETSPSAATTAAARATRPTVTPSPRGAPRAEAVERPGARDDEQAVDRHRGAVAPVAEAPCHPARADVEGQGAASARVTSQGREVDQAPDDRG